MAPGTFPLPGRLGPGLTLAGLLVLADQLTKLWAASALGLYQPVALMPLLNLTLSHNTGAAFSLLADQGGWQRWVLSALAVLISGALLVWLARLPRGQPWHTLGLAAVLGGAVGNLIDRLVHGYVIDFIDVHYGGWHYPAFNVADAAISIGVVALIIASFRESGTAG